MSRIVTELDFRHPDYRDAKVEDYEFRGDGKLVRKDRWECAIHTIKDIVGVNSREFEICEVVNVVRNLVDTNWWYIDDNVPNVRDTICVKLSDGSILKGAKYCDISRAWKYDTLIIPQVEYWKYFT